MIRFLASLFLLAAVLVPLRAEAHPHVFIDSRAEIVFDAQGRVSAVRHIWQFDEGFSLYAVQGLDADGDGTFSDEELAPLATVNIESLTEYGFFTFLTVDGEERAFTPPSEYWLEFEGTRLTLFFTLPLDLPAAISGEATLDVYDPEYFVAFEFVQERPFALIDAPAACRASFEAPEELDAATQSLLSQIPADQRVLPDSLAQMTSGLANVVRIVCGEGAPARPAPATPSVSSGGGPFGVAAPDGPSAGSWAGGPLGGVFLWIAERQAAFYRQLTGAISALKADGSAVWLLAGLSFLYGVFHAAGPGHGKAVLSAFLISSGASLGRGVAIAFAAAALQALVAIGLVAILAGLVNATAASMSRATNWLEVASYLLIVAIGARLLWMQFRGGHGHAHGHAHHHGHDGHDHHHHGHHDHHDHHHIADPAMLAGPFGLRQAAGAIAAIGIRPCSGAIIVLVFALAQGLFMAGVAATLVMAVGTGLTVAAIAALAVFARRFSLALAGGHSGRAAVIGRIIGVAGALVLLVLGILLLGGKLAAGGL